MELTIKDIEVAKINLEPGDSLAIVIKSDDVNSDTLSVLKHELERVFPANKILIFGMGLHDNMEFSVIKENSSCNTGSYCSDCSCGKKEQFLAEQGENDGTGSEDR